MDDVPAEHLQGAAQDNRRGDAVHVVVAVDGHALLRREGPLDPVHGLAHVGQQHRIVQVVEGRCRKRVATAGSPSPRWQSSRAIVGWTFSAAASAAVSASLHGRWFQRRVFMLLKRADRLNAEC